MILNLCCNDYRDGSPLGKSETIEICHSDVTVEFEGRPMVTRVRKDGRLQLGRFVVPIRGYRMWFGNWCWDAAQVDFLQGLRAATILLQAGWRITEGPEEIYDLANDKKPITKEVWGRMFQAKEDANG